MSRETLITTGACKENEDEFQQLSDALYDQYEPEGAIEQLLVEQLIGFQWRWRRVLRHENAAVRALAAESAESTFDEESRTGGVLFHGVVSGRTIHDYDAELRAVDAELAALQTPDPLAEYPQLAGTVLAASSPEFGVDVERLLRLDGSWHDHSISAKQIQNVIETACRRNNIDRAAFWATLSRRCSGRRHPIAAKIAHRDARVAGAVELATVPDATLRFAVSRYEAHLSRQFYRALHELTRIQSARHSHASPEVPTEPPPDPETPPAAPPPHRRGANPVPLPSRSGAVPLPSRGRGQGMGHHR